MAKTKQKAVDPVKLDNIIDINGTPYEITATHSDTAGTAARATDADYATNAGTAKTASGLDEAGKEVVNNLISTLFGESYNSVIAEAVKDYVESVQSLTCFTWDGTHFKAAPYVNGTDGDRRTAGLVISTVATKPDVKSEGLKWNSYLFINTEAGTLELVQIDDTEKETVTVLANYKDTDARLDSLELGLGNLEEYVGTQISAINTGMQSTCEEFNKQISGIKDGTSVAGKAENDSNGTNIYTSYYQVGVKSDTKATDSKAKTITISTNKPTATDGNPGDIWITYAPKSST